MIEPIAPATRAVLRRWGFVVVLWGVLVAVAATGGLLDRLPLPLLPVPLLAGIAIPLAVVLRSPRQQAVVNELDMAHLTLFNVWRVPAAAFFFAVGAAGALPERFVANAAWGDLIAGIAAPVAVLAAGRLTARAGRRVYLIFHLFSFGDFLVAVGTGLTFTLLGNPLMRTLLDTPMALIPLWGVPITGTISLLALRRLLSGHDTVTPSSPVPEADPRHSPASPGPRRPHPRV